MVLARSPSAGHHARVTAHADVEVIGVSEQAACFLVEIVIDGSAEVPDFSRFTQPLTGHPSSDWQVAYNEQLLDDAGGRVVTDLFLRRPAGWPEHARVVFYFHLLDIHRPLNTPFGEVTLPPPSDAPPRLSFLRYEAP